MTENFAIFDQSFFGCIDEFLDSLFTVGEYKPESRSRTFKFTEIRRKKYSVAILAQALGLSYLAQRNRGAMVWAWLA